MPIGFTSTLKLWRYMCSTQTKPLNKIMQKLPESDLEKFDAFEVLDVIE